MGVGDEFVYAYRENKYYKKYDKEKQKILQKYDGLLEGDKYKSGPTVHYFYKEGEREEYKQYLKEIADLIFKPNGNFQKMLWDTMGSHEKELMERRARGASHTAREL